jgi:hypothetical protein
VKALLPALASFRGTLLHRQECLCHKILAGPAQGCPEYNELPLKKTRINLNAT